MKGKKLFISQYILITIIAVREGDLWPAHFFIQPNVLTILLFRILHVYPLAPHGGDSVRLPDISRPHPIIRSWNSATWDTPKPVLGFPTSAPAMQSDLAWPAILKIAPRCTLFLRSRTCPRDMERSNTTGSWAVGYRLTRIHAFRRWQTVFCGPIWIENSTEQ